MNVLFSIALAMIGGLLLTRAAKLIKLPNVTAYLLAGLIMGPSCFGLIPKDALSALEILVTVALGFIAFSIGGEFKLSHLRTVGSKALIITLFQSLGAAVLVDAVLLLCGFDAAPSIVLGAIATATAPAATLMVVRQYRAKGEVTNTLLPVVAIDDAIGLMVFALSMAVAQTLTDHSALTLTGMVLRPVAEIGLSLLIGGVIGVLSAVAMRFFHSAGNRLSVCLAAVLLGVALAKQFDLSDLLLCMSIGAMLINLKNDADKVVETVDGWTPPLYLMFFVISGAQLDIGVLPTVGLIGALYIVTRSLGKYFGAYLGASVTHASPNVKKYLGITLLPQAGVAIGMAQLALLQLPAYGARIQAVVLAATLIYELIGPALTKLALIKAGEIDLPSKKPTRNHKPKGNGKPTRTSKPKKA